MTEDTTPIWHNSIAGDQVRAYVKRVENLEESKAEIATDIKETYAEAKANGFDTKTLRRVVKERKKDRKKREEEQSLFDLYWHALGMAALEDQGDSHG